MSGGLGAGRLLSDYKKGATPGTCRFSTSLSTPNENSPNRQLKRSETRPVGGVRSWLRQALRCRAVWEQGDFCPTIKKEPPPASVGFQHLCQRQMKIPQIAS